MPNKEQYARGKRGDSPNSVRASSTRGPSRLTELLPGQAGRTHNSTDAPADWGSDSPGDEQHKEGTPGSGRNGGMRYFRAINVSDREEREARGIKRLKYTWRTITGPAPTTDRGDLEAARQYLRKIEAAIDQGGWTSSEATGLYLAKKVWAARALGDDPRYNEVGNRQGGLTRQETANVAQRRIVIEMKRTLEEAGRSHGD